MHIIIDGYNLIRQSEVLKRYERFGLEAGRKELIRLLSLYRKSRGHRITVVFDGWMSGSPVEEREREGSITVVYSKRGEKADEVIKRMVSKREEETVVVTSDRDLADSISKRGSAAIPALTFESRLYAADTKCPHETVGEDEKQTDCEMARGTKKKGPSRKMSKKKKIFLNRIKKM
jgi:predicted RNA-binding protein with PIN domain